jgi:hypothetical protein
MATACFFWSRLKLMMGTSCCSAKGLDRAHEALEEWPKRAGEAMGAFNC